MKHNSLGGQVPQNLRHVDIVRQVGVSTLGTFASIVGEMGVDKADSLLVQCLGSQISIHEALLYEEFPTIALAGLDVGQMDVFLLRDGDILDEGAEALQFVLQRGDERPVLPSLEYVRTPRPRLVEPSPGLGKGVLSPPPAIDGLSLDLVDAVVVGIVVREAPLEDVVGIHRLHEVVQAHVPVIEEEAHLARTEMGQTEPGQHPVAGPLPAKAGIAVGGTQIRLLHAEGLLIGVDVVPIQLVRRRAVHANAEIHGALALGPNPSRTGDVGKDGGRVVHGRDDGACKGRVRLVGPFRSRQFGQARLVDRHAQIHHVGKSPLHGHPILIKIEELGAEVVLRDEAVLHLLRRQGRLEDVGAVSRRRRSGVRVGFGGGVPGQR
mmetsp:Transcript_2534/g.7430  ORF Transcript_2534/g.7430 Transcript_2534/m.7430 type:complete len:379 (+) Transcript_2534:950-2086(+)